MNISGIISFSIWAAVFVGLLSWRAGVWPWEWLRSPRSKGSLIAADAVPVPEKNINHWCLEANCMHHIAKVAYDLIGLSEEAYWYEHWFYQHGSAAPYPPYLEVHHDID